MRFTNKLLRRTTAALSMAAFLALGVGASQAAEKLPDLMNAKARASFNTPIAGSLSLDSGTYDRIYTKGDVDADCGAETFDSANDGMYYDIYCLQVDDNQPIELIVDALGTNIFDTVLTLYCTEFDPRFPDANVIAFDDDSGEGTLSALTAAHDVRLQEGHEYTLVISTYGASMTGDYVIQPSSNVYDCGAVSQEHTSWGHVKGLYR
ncbi:hypothetical protein KDM41_00825 [bacterium]|nr:hypothetical protein [bacterium]